MRKIRLGVLSFFVSILALIIAFLGFINSKQALQYQKEQDSLNKSPSLLIQKFGENLIFDLDKENARLQTVILNLPDSLSTKPILAYGSETEILISDISSKIKYFFNKNIKPIDSAVLVGELKIPVVFDYEVVVDRETKVYREDHFLTFIVSFGDKQPLDLKFDYSRFNFKLPIPLKNRSFFKTPLKEVDHNKIRQNDNNDLSAYLNNRFSYSIRSFKKYSKEL